MALKGLSYDNASINLGKGEQHQPSYGAVNPQEIVPTLENHGRLITQSLAICEYLDLTHPLAEVASCSSSISRTRAEGDAEILRFMCCPPSSAGSHTHCSGSLLKPVKAFILPFAFQSPLLREYSGKIAGNHSLHTPTRANIPTGP